jgi:uncharacterized protein (DUF305 family)
MVKPYFSKIMALNLVATAMLVSAGSVMAAHHEPEGHTHPASAHTVSNQMPSAKCDQMMLKSLGKADAQYDLRFMNQMITHHQAAIQMAQDALSKATHPEIKQMAQAIITQQQQEVAQLKDWRKAWYGQ